MELFGTHDVRPPNRSSPVRDFDRPHRSRPIDYGCPPSIWSALERELGDLFGGAGPADPGSSGVTLHYQPILQLATGEIRGYEALIRWCHADYGSIPPAVVIAIAEDTGLIVALGEWVLDRAIQDAVVLDRAATTRRYISVNVSAAQLQAPDFADGLRGLLATSGLDPSLLVVEITESLRLDDDDPIWNDLAALRELGVRVAIDDYGTGYASLSYLRHPVIDMLKLDQTFLAGIADDRSRVILRSLLALTDGLGIDLVAEGVEDEVTVAILVEAGCALGQGHLFAPAMPLGDVLRWKSTARPGRQIDLSAATECTMADRPSASAGRLDRFAVAGTDPARLRTADVFVEIADTLVVDFDLSAFLHMFTDRCVHLLNISAAGLLLADGSGHLRAVAASSEQVRLLDELQVKSGRGPAIDCFHTAAPIAVTDLAYDRRWPTFTATVVKTEFGVIHVLPMRLRSDTIGALTLLDSGPAPLTRDTLRIGQSLADAATIGLLHQRAITTSDAVTSQLQGALSSRIVIEQAKGTIAERLNVSIDAAFTILRSSARRQNCRLAEFAQEVVDGNGNLTVAEVTVTSGRRTSSPAHVRTEAGEILTEAVHDRTQPGPSSY